MIQRHRVLSVVLALYLVGLAWVCLAPSPFGGAAAALATKSGMPVAMLVFAANVMFFVPMGLLLLLLTNRKRWMTVLFIGLLASCWITLAQAIWLPSRDANPMHLVAHVMGTALGIGLAVLIYRARAADRQRSLAHA